MNRKQDKALLSALAKDTGLTVDQMIQQSMIDGVTWGICPECEYTTSDGVDPDGSGWCEECTAPSVLPVMTLAGLA